MGTPVIKLEHADSRGEIYSITLPGDKELMLLHSKAGTLRGGHAHDVNELVMVLTGKMKYYKKTHDEGTEMQFEVGEGRAVYHSKGEYHLAEFIEDSWVLEWKIATDKNSWVNIDYEPYRELVRANAEG